LSAACKTFGGRAGDVTPSFGSEKSPLFSRAASAGRQIHPNFFLVLSRDIKGLQDLKPKKLKSRVFLPPWRFVDAVADPPGECEAFVRSVRVDRVRAVASHPRPAHRRRARSTTAPTTPALYSTNSPFQKEIVVRPWNIHRSAAASRIKPRPSTPFRSVLMTSRHTLKCTFLRDFDSVLRALSAGMATAPRAPHAAFAMIGPDATGGVE
jgi:hypothetical protein